MPKTIISVDIKKAPKDQPTPIHNRWHPDIPPVATDALDDHVRRCPEPGLGRDVAASPDLAPRHGVQLPGPARHLERHQLLDGSVLVDAAVEEVRVEVVELCSVSTALVGLVGPEVPRALAVDRDVGLGDLAQVVLRERVAVAVAQAPEVRRLDVRDAVRGPPDLGAPSERNGDQAFQLVEGRRPVVDVRDAVRRSGAGRSCRADARGRGAGRSTQCE